MSPAMLEGEANLTEVVGRILAKYPPH